MAQKDPLNGDRHNAGPQENVSRPERAHLRSRITFDTGICGGRPCIRSMRIRVSDILEMLSGGTTRPEILANYPYLEDDDITAALDYAAESSNHRVISSP